MKPSRPTSQTAKRVGAIMHVRPTTRWLPKEIKAFRLLLPIEESELASVERYYRMNWPPRHGKNALRTDLYTFLNNWTGELLRADTFNELHPDKPKPRVIIPLPPTSGEPFVPTADEAESIKRFEEQRKLRKAGA